MHFHRHEGSTNGANACACVGVLPEQVVFRIVTCRERQYSCLPRRIGVHGMSVMHCSPLDLLPHGSEFRFVDELVALEPGRAATALYQIRGNEAFLAGHFPGRPMMPGVILVEAIAQLGGVVAQCDPAVPALKDLRLTGIRAAKILGAAVPGETLEIQAEVEGRLGGLIQIAGEITVAGRPLASAKIVLSGE